MVFLEKFEEIFDFVLIFWLKNLIMKSSFVLHILLIDGSIIDALTIYVYLYKLVQK